MLGRFLQFEKKMKAKRYSNHTSQHIGCPRSLGPQMTLHHSSAWFCHWHYWMGPEILPETTAGKHNPMCHLQMLTKSISCKKEAICWAELSWTVKLPAVLQKNPSGPTNYLVFQHFCVFKSFPTMTVWFWDSSFHTEDNWGTHMQLLQKVKMLIDAPVGKNMH